jgi:hypothetical protein
VAEYDDSELIRSLQNFRRLQRSDVTSRLASLPGTFQTTLQEGPTAGLNYAMQFRKQGQMTGLSMDQKMDLKHKLLELRAEAEKNTNENTRERDKNTAQGQLDAFKYALDATASILGDAMGGSATVQAARNAAIASVSNGYSNALMDVVGGTQSTGGNALRQMNMMLFGNPETQNLGLSNVQEGLATGEVYSAIANQLSTLHSDPQATAAVLANAEMMLGPDWLAMAPPESANDASYIDSVMRTNLPAVRQMQLHAEQQISDVKNAAIAKFAGGIGAPDPSVVAEMVEKLMQSRFADFEAGAKVDSEIVDGLPDEQGASPTLDQLDKLLADLDQPQEFIPATAREAKMQLLSSPEFQQWKKANGLMDDGMAFKAFRRHFGERIRNNKRADAVTMQQMQAGGAVMPEQLPGMQAKAQPQQMPRFAPGVPQGASATPVDPLQFQSDAEAEQWIQGQSTGAPPVSFNAVKPSQAIADILTGKRKPPPNWS